MGKLGVIFLKFKKVIGFTGIIAGLSLVWAASPMIGEMVATLPPLLVTYPREYQDMQYEDVSFPTTDGLTLRGWFFPNSNRDAPVILYAPATAKDQRQGLSLVAPLHKAGYQVLLFSYRGSGTSDGNRLAFSYGARESTDIDAAVRYLTETRGIQKIGAIGHSAGAVSIILSAARNSKIDAVVAAAPFTTLEDIWQDNRPLLFPVRFYRSAQRFFQLRKDFSEDQVRPLDVIREISPRPVLLIYGGADKRIPKSKAAQLYKAAASPKEMIWLGGTSHAGVRSPGLDILADQIVSFFNRNLKEKSVIS